MSSRLVLSLGLLVSLAMPAMTRAAEDMRLGEGVTWMRSATSLEPPRGLDLEPYDLSEEPDENLVVELYRIGYRLSDETIERSVTRVYKYLSEDAIRDHGNLRSYFDASGDRLEIARAFVVDSDGRMHPTEPNTVQILPTDTFDIFSDGRYALLPLKGLDAGSRAVIVDRIISRRDASVAPWGVMPTLQFGVPQERIEISVEWTRPELKPEWRVDLESIACEESDQAVRCEATDVPPYEVDSDVYYDDVLPRFYVAEPRDWQDIRRWYSSLFGSAISSSDSVAAMASRLSDGLDDETEKLKAIHEFVATQVRYVGLEHGDSAYVPHDTALTLERRYGDCKDKTALLIDMLSQVGIDMSPVLVATDRRDPDRLLVPSSSYFDHLIVCGTLSNGKEYCLDGTDPYTGTETLSRWIQGAVALPVHGESGPVTLPVDEYQWVLDEDLTLTLTDDGGLLESSRVDYKGVYGSVIRGIVSGMSSTELRDWARDDYHATVSELADPEFRIKARFAPWLSSRTHEISTSCTPKDAARRMAS